MPSRGKGYEQAWKFLVDPEFFQAPFGPSTVERLDPLFFIYYKFFQMIFNFM